MKTNAVVAENKMWVTFLPKNLKFYKKSYPYFIHLTKKILYFYKI